jgi:(2R)-sulfolactate sulfo-lyase subunit alpha
MAKFSLGKNDGAVGVVPDKSGQVRFLVHDKQDTVGVAVEDIQKGEEITGLTLDGQARISIPATMDIPLGHKVALKDFKPGEVVVKYGEKIGIVVAEIHKGDHVHVHNLKTTRW